MAVFCLSLLLSFLLCVGHNISVGRYDTVLSNFNSHFSIHISICFFFCHLVFFIVYSMMFLEWDLLVLGRLDVGVVSWQSTVIAA